MTDKATGEPIDPGWSYRAGEDGPEPLVVPKPGYAIDLGEYASNATFTFDNSDAVLERIAGLRNTTFTLDGTFDTDTATAPLFAELAKRSPIAVSIQIPASRWQAFKARLKRIRGLGWIPVRYTWKREFTGHIEPWEDGTGFTINQQPEEH